MPMLLTPQFRGAPNVLPVSRAVSSQFFLLGLKTFSYSFFSATASALNLASGATLGMAFASGSTYNYVNLTFGAETLASATPYLRCTILNGVSTIATFDIPLIADRDSSMQNFVFVTDFPWTLLNLTNLSAGNMSVSSFSGTTGSPSENINDFEFKNLINAMIGNTQQANNLGKNILNLGPNVIP